MMNPLEQFMAVIMILLLVAMVVAWGWFFLNVISDILGHKRKLKIRRTGESHD